MFDVLLFSLLQYLVLNHLQMRNVLPR